MCGIVGFQGGYSEDSLRLALLKFKHRGPDGDGAFIDAQSHTGLAHARLAIIDLSETGHQPMLSKDGSVALVFNGEIYNFAEIRRDLESRGHLFRGSSDTEVILNAYLQFGRQMLSMLNGIFAIAIYDNRDGSVLLARDSMGVKPVYYSVNPNGFAFASEIKALREIIKIDAPLDYKALADYLTYLWCPGDATPVKSVKKLLPGEMILVKDGKIQEKTLWYQPVAWDSVSCIQNLEEAMAGTERHLAVAVQRQMVSDVPVGAFLSGGLDSTSIVSFAKKIKPDIECFTIRSTVQDPGVTDDYPYALEAARFLGVKLHTVNISPEMMLNGIRDLVYQLDEPLADPAPLNVLFISQIARKAGFKVLLSGAAGDDLFSGYRRHQLASRQHILDKIPGFVRHTLIATGGRLNTNSAFGRKVSKALRSIQFTGNKAIVNAFRWINQDVVLSLFGPEAKSEIVSLFPYEPMLDYLQNCPSQMSNLQKMLALEQRFFLADHNLLYTDKMSMAAGVEVRVPFLDLELVNFASKIPDRWKQAGAEGKWILKKVMEPHLPKDLIYRKKTGFGAPLRQWIRVELHDFMRELLSPTSLERRGLWNIQAVNDLIEANQTGIVDASYTIFSLMCIELWFRHFLD